MRKLPAPYDRLLWPVYVPSLLVAASQTALLVLLPLYVVDLGLGAALAATIVGIRGIGLFAFDVPAGILASRFGDRSVLLSGLALIVAGTLLLAASASPWILSCGALISGAGFAAWMLGRQSYIADTCDNREVGRAMAVMAGLQRVGMLIGPALGGWLVTVSSYPLTYAAGAAVAVLAGLIVGFSRHATVRRHGSGKAGLASTFAIAREHRQAFLTAGCAALALQLMRATRQLLVPLFGVAIGLSAAEVGLIYSLSAGIDMCLFYPVGWLVDRHGRKWSAVPSLVGFAIGLMLLPAVAGFGSLLAVACLLGFANGLGTGIVMIIGADLSRRASDRGQFLGVWRLIGDVGMSGAPLLSAALVGIAGLGAASFVAAGLGLAGAVVMLTIVPETLERAKPR